MRQFLKFLCKKYYSSRPIVPLRKPLIEGKKYQVSGVRYMATWVGIYSSEKPNKKHFIKEFCCFGSYPLETLYQIARIIEGENVNSIQAKYFVWCWISDKSKYLPHTIIYEGNKNNKQEWWTYKCPFPFDDLRRLRYVRLFRTPYLWLKDTYGFNIHCGYLYLFDSSWTQYFVSWDNLMEEKENEN